MSNGKHTSDAIPLDRVRVQLSRIWFIGSGLIFMILVSQTVMGQKYKLDEVQKVWSWFVPTTFPTLSLMVGVLGAGATDKKEVRFVKRGFKSLTLWLSLMYLVVLAATILLEPLSQLATTKLFEISNYYLTPIQGLVVTAIGFIFTSSNETEKSRQNNNPNPPEST